MNKKRTLLSKRKSRTLRKNFKKNGLLFVNAMLIVAVTAFVWGGHNGAASTEKTVSFIDQNTSDVQLAPLDTLSSADIAANIALATGLPEEIMVVNQADSYAAQLNQATTEESVVTKPQIVTGAAVSKNDIVTYQARQGDTVASVAKQFDVSEDSIRWSNDISGNTIPSGKKLAIPPINGVVYTVASGDTLDSLASKYRVNKADLIAVNDIELSGLRQGERIFIAGGRAPAAPTYTNYYASTSSTSYGFVAKYGGNGYFRGYCTWYAAARVPVPSNWGNANTWDNRARLSGWTVSKTPVVGAVAQTDGMSWWGHVAVVEAVSADKTQIKYSDMNGLAGFGRVGYSDWVPATMFQNYIYR